MYKLPSGSKQVISLLNRYERLSFVEIDELLEEINEAELRYAIRRLLEIGILVSVPHLLDMRIVYYQLAQSEKYKVEISQLPQEIGEILVKSDKVKFGV